MPEDAEDEPDDQGELFSGTDLGRHVMPEIAPEDPEDDLEFLFYLACGDGDEATVAKILEQDPSVANCDRLPLSRAMISGHLRCMELLLDAGARIDSLNSIDFNYVHDRAAAKLLLRHGADIHALLSGAVSQPNADVVKYLIAQGANVNHPSEGAPSGALLPALIASFIPDRGPERNAAAGEVLDILFDAGVNPNQASHKGFTALHVACEHNLAAVVKKLLARGADPCIRNSLGDSAFEIARPNQELLQLLEPHRERLVPLHADWPAHLIEKLLTSDEISREDFVPCSDAEIAALEREHKVRLPETYKRFLRTMGKGPDVFVHDNYDHFSFDYATIRKEYGTHHFSERNEHLDGFLRPLVESGKVHNFFIFATRMGDVHVGFFLNGEDDDPPIFYIVAGEDKLEPCGESFWDFFRWMVDEYV